MSWEIGEIGVAGGDGRYVRLVWEVFEVRVGGVLRPGPRRAGPVRPGGRGGMYGSKLD